MYDVDIDGNISLSMNALLVEKDDRLVLFDPGCCDFLPAKLRQEYQLTIPVPIESQLSSLGYGVEQVTDVIFTHLHFDHGSGAFRRVPGNIEKRFNNARYHVLREHYQANRKPVTGESHSFFTSFLKYIDAICWLEEWKDDWLEFRIYNGHTPGMVVPVIHTEEGDIYYGSDLLPMEVFLNPVMFSGYDANPELVREEKRDFLAGVNEKSQLILFHDPLTDSIIYP